MYIGKIQRLFFLKMILVIFYLIIASYFQIPTNGLLKDFSSPDFNYSTGFEYPALMRVIYLPIYMAISLLGEGHQFISSLLFMVPIAIADFLVLSIFLKLFKDRESEIKWFYLFSIITLYISYVRLDLDIIPLSVLFLSIYYLTKERIDLSAFFLGLSIATKNPALLALPIIIMYIYKTSREKNAYILIKYLAISFLSYLMISLPYITNSDYLIYAIKSNTLELLTGTYYSIGALKIYLAPAGLAIVYIRFVAYKKVNKQLMFDYLGLVFSVFVLCIEPLYNWYLWPTIFMSVMYINKYRTNRNIASIYITLSALYLIFFTGAYTWVDSNVSDAIIKNAIYTCLEIVLLASCYGLYKFGIKSNRIYKDKHSSFIIGIGGDSGSGKSTLIKAIEALLGAKRIVHIEADGDHKWERGDIRWKEVTHLNPKANYLYKQANYLKELKNGNNIHRVEYEHNMGKFTDLTLVKPNDYIIVAGLHPFYLPQTRRIMDLKIYVDTDEKLRKHWKIVRDTQNRGYTKGQILNQIDSRIDDACRYIHPQKNFADFIIKYYTENEFELGDAQAKPIIKLQIKLPAEIDLDEIIGELISYNAEICNDFDQDLKYQTIILEKPIELALITQIISRYVENIEEILDENALRWYEGYEGFVQMMILFAVAHKMRGTENDEI